MQERLLPLARFPGLALVVLTCALPAEARDWPRWRGPDLTGISQETNWSVAWPESGPKQLWKAAVGTGFSSVAVADGRLFTLGNRNNQDTVYCLDAAVGKVIWQHRYACPLDPRYYDGGTSSTPAVDGNRVYTISRKGDVFCLEAGTGKVVWQKNLNTELGLTKFKEETPEWGYAGSALVQGDLLILNVGTAGTALEKGTGKLVWNTGKTHSGYATPVPFKVGDQEAVAVFGAKAIRAVAIKNGEVLWSYDWETSYDVNAADPILSGDRMFISSGYGRGASVIRFGPSGASKVWENKDMRNQLNSSVLIDGYLYGFDGDHGDRNSTLRCLEFETGRLRWSEASVRPGGIMVANKKLIVMGDTGNLIIAEASPASFKALARAQVLGGKCWTVPVLSHGRIYCRNSKGDLVCVDVQSPGGAPAGP